MFFIRTLFSICLLSASMCFVGLALLVRSIPALAELCANIVRFLLKWSFRLYRRILIVLDPYIQGYLGRSALELPVRIIFCLILSNGLGCIISLLLHLHISWVALLLFSLHGMLIAGLWTDFFEPQGLHIGERLP